MSPLDRMAAERIAARVAELAPELETLGFAPSAIVLGFADAAEMVRARYAGGVLRSIDGGKVN